MDFELPEELADVQKLAHDFAEKESRRAPRNMTGDRNPGRERDDRSCTRHALFSGVK